MASRQNEFFEDVSESEELAKRADPNTNVFLIPAFVGLGAPIGFLMPEELFLDLQETPEEKN